MREKNEGMRFMDENVNKLDFPKDLVRTNNFNKDGNMIQ